MQNETPDFPTRLAACARQLRRHGFEAVCVADLAEAGRRLRDEIARCAPRSISYGDSMTLRATGIVEELRNGSRYEFIDGFDPALPRPEHGQYHIQFLNQFIRASHSRETSSPDA